MASRAALDRFISRTLPAGKALPLYQCISCFNRYFGTDADMEDHARWEKHRPNDRNKLARGADGLYPGFVRVGERNKPGFFCQACKAFIGTELDARKHQANRGHLTKAQDQMVSQAVNAGQAPLEPLPAPSTDGLAAINAAIDELFETKRMKPADLEKRQAIVRSLQEEIRRRPGLGALELQLFGSSCSGFGTPMSDLDVVITSPEWDVARFINARGTAAEQVVAESDGSESAAGADEPAQPTGDPRVNGAAAAGGTTDPRAATPPAQEPRAIAPPPNPNALFAAAATTAAGLGTPVDEALAGLRLNP